MSKSLKSVSVDQMQAAIADALLQLTGDQYRVNIAAVKFAKDCGKPDGIGAVEFTVTAERPDPWDAE